MYSNLSPGLRIKWLLLLSALVQILFWSSPARSRDPPSGELEIHYINVGQGGSTLIVGPDGSTILFDYGAVAGRHDIVPYLRAMLGLKAREGIDYAMVSHGDKDHYMGYKDVATEFDVLKANYEPGTKKARTAMMNANWFNPAKKTKAGAFKPVPVGLQISLGKGAKAFIVAANGVVHGEARKLPAVKNENDRSISLFVRYGNFHYILDGDLGAGPEKCTGHDTKQVDVQSRVARALIDSDLMTKEHGVDVMHIAHHGSESSTSSVYYNMMKPEVGLISVGKKQGSFLHPRKDVVDAVLLGGARAACVTAPPLKALFQTEEGLEGCSDTGCTSFSGMVVGDIKLVTDGKTGYTITVSNRLHGTPTVKMPVQTKWEFKLDESPSAPQ